MAYVMRILLEKEFCNLKQTHPGQEIHFFLTKNICKINSFDLTKNYAQQTIKILEENKYVQKFFQLSQNNDNKTKYSSGVSQKTEYENFERKKSEK